MVKNIKFFIIAKKVFELKDLLPNNYNSSWMPSKMQNLQSKIYIFYILISRMTLDHAKFLTIITNLGYPLDEVHLIGNVYSLSTTFIGEHFGHTQPIHI
jgi:hypothetical protein